MQSRSEHTNAVFEVCIVELEIGQPQVIDSMTNMGRTKPQSREELEEIGDYLALKSPDVLESAVEDFVENNLITQRVEKIYPIDDRFHTLTQAEMHAMFAEDIDAGWTKFRATYPCTRGTLGFSDLGFDDHYKQAILCVGQQFGGLMGRGTYFIFERKKSKWFVREQVMAWMS